MIYQCYHNGKAVSPQLARRAWVDYVTFNQGGDQLEAGAIWKRAQVPDTDGEDAREQLLDAGIEMIFA